MLLKRNYKPEEAAKILGIAQSTVYKYIDEGHLEATRTGPGKKAHILIPRGSLQKFINLYRTAEN